MENNIYFFIILVSAISFLAGRFSLKFNKSNYSKSFPINYFKGIDFLLNNQEDEALREFINAAKISSRNAEIFLALGNLFRKKGEFEKAIRIHQTILIQEDINIEIRKSALINLAKDFRKAGLYSRALVTLEKLEHIDKKNIPVMFEKIKIFILKKEWEQAILHYKKVYKNLSTLDKQNFSSIYVETAKGFISNRQFLKAKSLLKKSLKVYEENYYTYVIFGNYYFFKKNYSKAKYFYSKALNYNPFVILKIRTKLNIMSIDAKKLFDSSNFILSCLKIREFIKNQEYDLAEQFIKEEIMKYPQSIFLKNLFFIINCLKNGNVNAIKSLKNFTTLKFMCNNCNIVTKNFQWQCPNCKNWLTFEFIDR